MTDVSEFVIEKYDGTKYVYPAWAQWTGRILSAFTIACIPIGAVVAVIRARVGQQISYSLVLQSVLTIWSYTLVLQSGFILLSYNLVLQKILYSLEFCLLMWSVVTIFTKESK